MRPRVVLCLLPSLIVGVACGRTGLVPGGSSNSDAGGDAGSSTAGGKPALGDAGVGGALGGRPGAGGRSSSSGADGGSGAISTAGSQPAELCRPPSTRCDDRCVDLSLDRQHCGSCTTDCGDDSTCSGGKCVCRDASLFVTSHVPRSGDVGVVPSEVSAELNCAFDRERLSAQSARLYGSFSGAIVADFPKAQSPRALSLRPRPSAGRAAAYLPGERVTAWLGAALGAPSLPFQPFLWQFLAAVSKSSPGVFQPAAQALPALTQARSIALGDVDADGDLDAIVSGESALLLLRNHGNGTLDDAEPLNGAGVPVLGDVDGDGDQDLADGQQLLLNDGHGAFSPGPKAEGCIALGDIDADGDLDCVANLGFQSPDIVLGRVLLNSGDGTMQPGSDAPFGFDCELWDLDGDGDLDAACVSPVVTGASILLNLGLGQFQQSQALSKAGARGIALGDVDRDGDIDLLVSQWQGAGRQVSNLLYLNDGSAHFDDGAAVGEDGGAIALGDIDGDADLDVIYSHLTPYGPLQPPFDPSVIMLNDGRGRFTLSPGTLGDPAFQWFKLGDLDGDGDLDAFVFHQLGVSGNYANVWLNQK